MKKNLKEAAKKLVLAWASILVLSPTATSLAQEARPQDNLYQAANAEWLAKNPLKDDQNTYGTFDEITARVNQHLQEDIDALVSGQVKPANPEEKKFIDFYKQAFDFQRRDQEGIAPLKPYLDKIEAISSYQDLQALAAEWVKKSFPLPFSLTIDKDGQDASKKVLTLSSPAELYNYDILQMNGPEAIEAYRQVMAKNFELAGYPAKEISQKVDNLMKFYELIYHQGFKNAGIHEYTDLYKPMNKEEVYAYSKTFSFPQLFKDLTDQSIERFSSPYGDYFKSLDYLLTQENLPLMKDWMAGNLIANYSHILSEDIRVNNMAMNGILFGESNIPPKEDTAYDAAVSTFGHVLGTHYGKTHFGEANRAKAQEMVEKMINIYKERLKANSWLSQETIEKAIKKLDTMEVLVGYADDYGDFYRELEIDPDKSFVENYLAYNYLSKTQDYDGINEETSRDAWEMAAYTVNAYYSPNDNKIAFPAALFQAPLYDENQSISANYGGIGAIIGHEISHAFDSNGALYDEMGNLSNWWTEEDYKTFEEKTQAMVDQWDGLDYQGGKVDGHLTLSENIADNGGLSVALEALKSEDNPDYQAFFKAWARVWANQATDEYTQFALTGDVHAPKELRANIPPRNLQEFYDAFGVKEGDAMFLAPEKRVSIW